MGNGMLLPHVGRRRSGVGESGPPVYNVLVESGDMDAKRALVSTESEEAQLMHKAFEELASGAAGDQAGGELVRSAYVRCCASSCLVK